MRPKDQCFIYMTVEYSSCRLPSPFKLSLLLFGALPSLQCLLTVERQHGFQGT